VNAVARAGNATPSAAHSGRCPNASAAASAPATPASAARGAYGHDLTVRLLVLGHARVVVDELVLDAAVAVQLNELIVPVAHGWPFAW
jgi:hypothetical protein